MILNIISLLVIALAIRAVVRLARMFVMWLGRGKTLERALDEDRLSAEARQAADDAESWQAKRHLEGAAGVGGIPHPHLSGPLRSEVLRADVSRREEYLDRIHLGWYQVVLIFFLGSIAGLVLEETWMLVTAGLTQSRVGLVWGPFSPLYGFGAVLLTIVSFQLRKRHATWWQTFLLAVLIGGSLEQVTGWSMETLFHAQSWTYAYLPDAITQWVAWRFLFFWGVIGLVWSRFVMPELLYRIGMPTTRRQVIFVSLLAAYLSADIFMTLVCFNRQKARNQGIPAKTSLESWVDEHYSDEWIASRFQNLVVGTQL
ncbi:MAG: putative ABC transporter permease [Atopobiaceae bacterium]|jgi:uncharacterized membrane protein|nr:putative ABC transporter permease [Atopobiaceae bacterium]